LTIRERPAASDAAEAELAVEQLAAMMAGTDGDQLEALEAVARAATRLARSRRREVRLDEERPVAMMGAWSLENGMLPHIVLGEN
jgi:predicted RNA-binding protein Jag